MKQLTSMVADGDSDLVESLSGLLEIPCYKVVEKARNGKEVINLYHKLRPDVIILGVFIILYKTGNFNKIKTTITSLCTELQSHV